MSGIVRLPDGRIFFDAPYRIDQIPKHFHMWESWEYQGQEGEICPKCGLVNVYPPLDRNDYLAPVQVHNPRIYDPDTISEVYTETARVIREADEEETSCTVDTSELTVPSAVEVEIERITREGRI